MTRFKLFAAFALAALAAIIKPNAARLVLEQSHAGDVQRRRLRRIFKIK